MPSNKSTKTLLLTPGPTVVPDAVLRELARPMIHHRTRQFREIFDEVSRRLQWLFRTEGPVLSIAGSGTTAFEAAQVSLMPAGNCSRPAKALCIAAGKFGERWQDIFDAYGVGQIRLDVPWGQAPGAEAIGQALAEHRDISVVTLVVSETSTATACDLKAIAEQVRKTDALLIADGITAVGALPIDMDAWGVDVLVTGSQKALMLPPGLGYVALGRRALERLKRVEPTHCYNLDLRRWLKSWHERDVPFTPPVSLIRAQRVALEMMEKEGLENIWERTSRLATLSRDAFRNMGLKPVSDSPSDSLTGAFYCEGIDDHVFRTALREEHGIHIAGGQDGRGGQWKGKIMRISHMGYVNEAETRLALTAIETQLRERG